MSADDTVLQSTPALSAMYRLQWEEVQQSWVLLYPEGMVKLNGSAGEIIKRWKKISKPPVCKMTYWLF